MFPPRVWVKWEDHLIWQRSEQELHPLIDPIQSYLYEQAQLNPDHSEIRKLAIKITLAAASVIGLFFVFCMKVRMSTVKPYWLNRTWGEELLAVSGQLEFPEEIVQKCRELAEAERPFVEYVARNYRD